MVAPAAAVMALEVTSSSCPASPRDLLELSSPGFPDLRTAPMASVRRAPETCKKRGAQHEASASGTMDSNTSRQFESQREDKDPIFSQTALPHPNFYYPSFHVPPHGFQAMLNAPSISLNSPFMFRPPHSPMVTQSPNTSPPLGIPNMESPPNPQGPQASPNFAPKPSLASQPKQSRGKSTKRKEPSNEEVVPETQQPAPKKLRASKKK
ncbi:hypothetical protein L7F22_027331, partial [Adiantum nelumboides]|nr:hypothetical protein [Adiantum nelumboides]